MRIPCYGSTVDNCTIYLDVSPTAIRVAVAILEASGINVGQTEEAEDLYLYADASHTQIFRPNRRGYNARANDLNLPILWLDF